MVCLNKWPFGSLGHHSFAAKIVVCSCNGSDWNVLRILNLLFPDLVTGNSKAHETKSILVLSKVFKQCFGV